MNLGAFLTYSVSGDCTFSGSASASFGVNASLPDSAVITADYKNHGASSVSGFDSTDLTPMFRLDNGSASVTLSATSKSEIKFGFDLYHVGNVDVAVTVDLPEASVTLTALSGMSILSYTPITSYSSLIVLVQMRTASVTMTPKRRRWESRSTAKLVSRWPWKSTQKLDLMTHLGRRHCGPLPSLYHQSASQ